MHATSIRHSVTDSQFSYTRSVHRSRSPVRGRRTTVIENSPAHYGHTINHSPLRAVTTTRNLGGALATSNVVHHHSPSRLITNTVHHHSPARPIGMTEHVADRFGDTLVSYGVNEYGEQVRVASSGIISGPQIRTIAEKVSPPRTHVTSHVTHGYGGYGISHSTTFRETSPSRQFKETVYSPASFIHNTGYIARDYSPVRGSITRVDHSPLRGSYTRVDYSPPRNVTRVDYSPPRTLSRVDYSPVRRSFGVLEPVATVVDHAPVTVIRDSPARRRSITRVDYSPLRGSISRSVSPARSFTSVSPPRQVSHHYNLGTVVPNPAPVITAPRVRHYESPSRRVSYGKTVIEHSTTFNHHDYGHSKYY